MPDELNNRTSMHSASQAPPPGTPGKYIYMRTKAARYLHVGTDVSRRGDFFHMPQESWDGNTLALVAEGFRQILAWRGITADDPFTGLGIDGFYRMMEVLHFELKAQALMETDDPHWFLDRMTMKHCVDGGEIVLFNRVKPPVLDDEPMPTASRGQAATSRSTPDLTVPGVEVVDLEEDDAPAGPFPCPVRDVAGCRCGGTMRLNRMDFWECDACHRQAAGKGAMFVHKDATLVEVPAGEVWIFPDSELGDGDFQKARAVE